MKRRLRKELKRPQGRRSPNLGPYLGSNGAQRKSKRSKPRSCETSNPLLPTCHKSRAMTRVPGGRLMSAQAAVMLAGCSDRFQRRTTTRLPESGPAHTCDTDCARHVSVKVAQSHYEHSSLQSLRRRYGVYYFPFHSEVSRIPLAIL